MAVFRAVKAVLVAIVTVIALIIGFAYAACRDQMDRALNEPAEAPTPTKPTKPTKPTNKRSPPPKAEKDLPATR